MNSEKPKFIITLLGGPGAGKTTLATELSLYYSKYTSNKAYYVQEWIKDLANRKHSILPADQLAVFGNQAYLINGSVLSGNDLTICCSSPFLCAFYSNFYSNNAFPSLFDISVEWENYWHSKGVYHIILMYNPGNTDYKSRYNTGGRYENFETASIIHSTILEWCESQVKSHNRGNLFFVKNLETAITSINAFARRYQK